MSLLELEQLFKLSIDRFDLSVYDLLFFVSLMNFQREIRCLPFGSCVVERVVGIDSRYLIFVYTQLVNVSCKRAIRNMVVFKM